MPIPNDIRYPVIDMEQTGRNIRRLCDERGVTTRELMRFFHFVSPTTPSKWRNGHVLPSTDNLFALSRLLGTTVDSIVALKE